MRLSALRWGVHLELGNDLHRVFSLYLPKFTHTGIPPMVVFSIENINHNLMKINGKMGMYLLLRLNFLYTY